MESYDVDSPEIDFFPDTRGPSNISSNEEAAEGYLSGEQDDSELCNLNLPERWMHVVKQLIEGKLRWDDENEPDEGWSPEAPILDLKGKESLTELNERDAAFPSVIHGLAVNFSNGDFNKLQEATQVKVMGYLIQEHLIAKGHAGIDLPEGTVLTRAFTNQNADFIRFVIKNFSKHLAALVSDQDRNRSNCLHYIFKKHLPEAVDVWTRVTQPRNTLKTSRKITLSAGQTIHYLVPLIHSVQKDPQCIVAKDGDGNTPMHYAMAYRVCRMNAPQYKVLALQMIEIGNTSRDRLSQFNKAQESPYLYFERTKRDFMKHNALSRVQRRAQPAVSSISKRSGREDRSKLRQFEDRLAQLNVTGDEPGSIMSHANKKTTMRKPTMDAAEEANPPRSSSPPLEISKSAKTGMPNSGRATRATLAVESLSYLKPNGSDPAPNLTKPRVNVIEEEKIDKEGFDKHAGWAEDLHRQLKLQYIRTRSAVPLSGSSNKPFECSL